MQPAPRLSSRFWAGICIPSRSGAAGAGCAQACRVASRPRNGGCVTCPAKFWQVGLSSFDELPPIPTLLFARCPLKWGIDFHGVLGAALTAAGATPAPAPRPSEQQAASGLWAWTSVQGRSGAPDNPRGSAGAEKHLPEELPRGSSGISQVIPY